MSGRRGRPRGLRVDGDAVRRLRDRLGWSQAELAEAAGLTRRTVQTAEKGARLGRDSLRCLARALDVPHSLLLHPVPSDASRRLELGGLRPPLVALADDRHAQVRQALLDRLGSEPAGVACLTGPEGVGKSALAASVVRELERRLERDALWIDATRTLEPGGAVGVQLAIAEALGFAPRLPDPQHLLAGAFDTAFLRELWRHPRLLVLDQVSALRTARHFVPARLEHGGHVLVTTSSRALAEHAFAAHLVVLEASATDPEPRCSPDAHALRVALSPLAGVAVPEPWLVAIAQRAGLTPQRCHEALAELVNRYLVHELHSEGDDTRWRLARHAQVPSADDDELDAARTRLLALAATRPDDEARPILERCLALCLDPLLEHLPAPSVAAPDDLARVPRLAADALEALDALTGALLRLADQARHEHGRWLLAAASQPVAAQPALCAALGRWSEHHGALAEARRWLTHAATLAEPDTAWRHHLRCAVLAARQPDTCARAVAEHLAAAREAARRATPSARELATIEHAIAVLGTVAGTLTPPGARALLDRAWQRLAGSDHDPLRVVCLLTRSLFAAPSAWPSPDVLPGALAFDHAWLRDLGVEPDDAGCSDALRHALDDTPAEQMAALIARFDQFVAGRLEARPWLVIDLAEQEDLPLLVLVPGERLARWLTPQVLERMALLVEHVLGRGHPLHTRIEACRFRRPVTDG